MYDTELSLQDYVQIFARRWWVVALTALACTTLALAWTARQTPLYSSSASILINQANASDLFDPVGTGNTYSYAERLAATEARFLTSGIVSTEAINRLGYEAYVDVSEDDFADVLTVSAIAADPAQAQQVAQTYAETYVEVREQRFASERTSIANQLAERLAEIDLQITDATGADLVRLDALRKDVAESFDLLNLTAGLAGDSGTIVIDNAELPGAPFSPRTNRNVALGLVLGLMSGAGLVLVLEALDRSVNSRETLESLTPGAPNLAIIPRLGKALQRQDALVSQSDPTGPSAEAFRTLRAALQYVAIDDSARVIQIASAHSAAGKTTVAANLAVTLAQSGQRVVVIDADLRRPRLHQLFGVAQAPGLTSAIIGAAPFGDCIQHVQSDTPTPHVLASGPIPPGPAELLGSAAAASAIEKIRNLADYVIIDTAPVLPVADTAVLSRYVDASILVVDASKTTRADVTAAFELLQQAGAPVVGTVLNKVKVRRGMGGYGYGYGHGYGGYEADGARGKTGLVGWFTRSAPEPKIERLHGKDVPRITAAPRKPPAEVAAASEAETSHESFPSFSSFSSFSAATNGAGAREAGSGESGVTAKPRTGLPVVAVEPAVAVASKRAVVSKSTVASKSGIAPPAEPDEASAKSAKESGGSPGATRTRSVAEKRSKKTKRTSKPKVRQGTGQSAAKAPAAEESPRPRRRNSSGPKTEVKKKTTTVDDSLGAKWADDIQVVD